MLNKFIKFVEENNLNVDSIIISAGNKRYEHFFKPDSRNNIRSISKGVCALGVFKAMEYNLFDLDTCVMPFFANVNITNHNNIEHLSRLKIGHLLNLTMGHERGLMFSKDIKKMPTDTDFISYILNYDILHNPGTFFVYNNAASYLLCSIVQSLTSMYFADWIYETIFRHLEIERPTWEHSAQGVCLGASGLYLNNTELHKIGLLFLCNGEYNGLSLVDEKWIKAMRSPKFFTADLPEYAQKQTRSINKMAYGYHCWICGDGSSKYPKTHYFIDGTDGQFLIVSPKQNMVITILSHQADMSPFYKILEDYLTI